MSYTSVPHLSTEHQDWLKAIDFYDNELDILEKRLAEVATKNTGIDAMKGVEHFQNQFIIQRNTIDELRHNINEHVHKTMLDAKDHGGRGRGGGDLRRGGGGDHPAGRQHRSGGGLGAR